MDVQVTEAKGIRNASAYLRHGVVHVKLPKAWPLALKEDITGQLVQRVLKKEAAEQKLFATLGQGLPLITLDNEADLSAYVFNLNAQTFQAPLAKVKIGDARYTRLAQVNLKTRIMTVSRFCLTEVPESALRYLIVHELAHFLERGHNAKFWNQVARFVPDYRAQSRLMKAFHRRAVLRDQEAQLDLQEPLPLAPPPVQQKLF